MARHQSTDEVDMSLEERIATSLRVMALSRLSMLLTGVLSIIMTVVIIPAGTYVAVRYVNAMDQLAEQQSKNLRDFALLQIELRHTVSDTATSAKNLVDRMELGEKLLSDRLNAQAERITVQQSALQLITIELHDLAKFVYTKVR